MEMTKEKRVESGPARNQSQRDHDESTNVVFGAVQKLNDRKFVDLEEVDF